MHNAPSVIFPVGRSRLLGALLLGVWLSGWGAAVAFAWVARDPWRASAIGLVALLTGFSAWRWWWRSPGGQLQFTGKEWVWLTSPAGNAQTLSILTVHVDVQHALLLRAQRVAAPALWLWLERRAGPRHWDDLRRAVYSPASAAASTLQT